MGTIPVRRSILQHDWSRLEEAGSLRTFWKKICSILPTCPDLE